MCDVSRAYVYAPAGEQIDVELCEEDRDGPQDESNCGRLRMAMYGTRSAARSWQKEFGQTLRDAGFVQGKSNPCLSRHPGRCIRTFVYGDDFVSSADVEARSRLQTLLEHTYNITSAMIVEGDEFEKRTAKLNRILEWHDGVGIRPTADPRHVKVLLDTLDCKFEFVEGSS